MRDHLLTHVVEPPALAHKAVAAIRDATGPSFVSLVLRDPSGIYAMHGAAGARQLRRIRQIQVTPGQGIGGRRSTCGDRWPLPTTETTGSGHRPGPASSAARR